MIAFSAAGRRLAARIVVMPPYEWPHMPTLPSHQGCAAAHGMASTASCASSGAKGTRGSPSEVPVPSRSSVMQA